MILALHSACCADPQHLKQMWFPLRYALHSSNSFSLNSLHVFSRCVFYVLGTASLVPPVFSFIVVFLNCWQ